MDHQVKQDLALAYRIVAHLKMDDHTYTHISARPEGADYFYMAPFGMTFAEVNAKDLIKIPLSEIHKAKKNDQYNITGCIIHGAIYEARNDINSIMHLHTHEIVAVSSIKEGLMSINQWALHFYDSVSYSDYDSLVMYQESRDKITSDLGSNKVMLLRNHGSITCGSDLQEALFYTYHLQQACKTQIYTLSMGQEIVVISANDCKKTMKDLLSFEENIGHRDWKAWQRIISF